MLHTRGTVAAAAALATGLIVATTALHAPAPAHEGHPSFAAGEPGNPKKPARTIKVVMKEMMFEPSLIEVCKGEQIRFILANDGTEDHEFMLATASENRKHGELMKKYPDMSTTIRTASGFLHMLSASLFGNSPKQESSSTPA